MNCRRAARLLCFDVGGDLSPRRSAAVAGHVAICPACRSFRDDLSAALENARSLEVPSWERDGEELRRRVWSEIRRDHHGADTRKAERPRLLVAAAGFTAAVLLFLHVFALRPAAEFGQLPPRDVAPAITSAPVPPDSAGASASASPAAPLSTTALASRPRTDAREGGITRIEFQTPNQVRIIWLVEQEAPETSPALSPGPKQEVS
jgi:putative zinc finger protein